MNQISSRALRCEDKRSLELWFAPAARAMLNALLFLGGFAAVARLPFREDALVVLRGPIKIVVDHLLERLFRIELHRRRQVGPADHCIVLAVQLESVVT